MENNDDNESAASSNVTTPKSRNPSDDEKLFWNGNYPTPVGPAALALSTVDLSMQRIQADKLCELVEIFPADFQNILAYSSKVPYLVHLPGKGRKVRIIHNVDTYKSGAQDKLIGMYNDSIEDLRPPELASIDKALLLRETFKIPSAKDYESNKRLIKENEGKGFVSHSFTKTSLRETFITGRMTPVPAYLVYDGLENDLDALDVYERLVHEATHLKGQIGEAALVHAAKFVRLGMVAPSQKGDICIPSDMLNATLPREALRWRVTQMNAIVNPEAERALSLREGSETKDKES